MQLLKVNNSPFSNLFDNMANLTEKDKNESDHISIQISNINGNNGHIGEALESSHEAHGAAEISLLRAVILQAIVDRMSNSKRTEEKVAKHDASEWFNMKNSDFKLICDLSGWSPDWVLNVTTKAVQSPEKWRRNHERYGEKNKE